MGDSKFLLIFGSLLTALVLSFQSCGKIQSQGNGDPYEGVDINNGSIDSITLIDDTGGDTRNGNTSGEQSPPPSSQPLTSFVSTYVCYIQTSSDINDLQFGQDTGTDDNMIYISNSNGNSLYIPTNQSYTAKQNYIVNRQLSSDIYIQNIVFNSETGVAEIIYINGTNQRILHKVQCYE